MILATPSTEARCPAFLDVLQTFWCLWEQEMLNHTSRMLSGDSSSAELGVLVEMLSRLSWCNSTEGNGIAQSIDIRHYCINIFQDTPNEHHLSLFFFHGLQYGFVWKEILSLDFLCQTNLSSRGTLVFNCCRTTFKKQILDTHSSNHVPLHWIFLNFLGDFLQLF